MQTFHNALNWEKGGLKKRNSRVIHPKTKHGGGGVEETSKAEFE